MPDIFIAKKQKKEPKKKEPKTSKGKIAAGAQKKKIKGLSISSHNPLSSFCYRPPHINFETRDRQEKVVLLLRRHPITNLGWIVVFALMLFAPAILNVFPLR